MADPRNLIKLVPAVTLVLAGCANEEETMSPEELRDRFAVLVEETQEVVGGEFEIRDGTDPLHCSLEDGRDGRSYGFTRIGPPPEEVETVVAAVRGLWESHGYPVRESTVGPAVELATRTDDGAPIVFAASEHAVTLGGESGCGVPDAGESAGS